MDVDIQKLFEATRRDAIQTAVVLVLLEASGGDPVEIPDDTPWRQNIIHHRREVRQAIGIGKENYVSSISK